MKKITSAPKGEPDKRRARKKSHYPNGDRIAYGKNHVKKRETIQAVEDFKMTVEQLVNQIRALHDRIVAKISSLSTAIEEGVKEAMGTPMSFNECCVHVGLRRELVQRAVESGDLPSAHSVNKNLKKQYYINPAAARDWANRVRQQEEEKDDEG